MAERLFVASLEPGAGRSLVTLGLMEALSRRHRSVGYVRPITASSTEPDPRIELVLGRYDLDVDPSELSALGFDEVADLLATGKPDEVYQRILEVGRRAEERFDFVLYDGTDFTGAAAAREFEINAHVAMHLGAPVLALVNGGDRPAAAVVDAAMIARESLATEGCSVAALVVNRVEPHDLQEVRTCIAAQGISEPVWILPEVPLLRMPTVREIFDALDADELGAGPADLDHEVSSVKVAAMSLPNVLAHLEEGLLLIVAADRPAVVIGALMSRTATTFPNIAALVLTGGFPLDAQVERLVEGLVDNQVPILAVAEDTFTTAQRVGAVPAVIRSTSERKIATAIATFEEHVDLAELERTLTGSRTSRVTPLMFTYDLLQRASAGRRHIVLPEGDDDRVLTAAERLLRRQVVDLTLLGDVEQVRARVAALGLDLGDTPIIDPRESPLLDEFAETYMQMRSHKGVTGDEARQTLLDVSYFGTLMVHAGYADGMVSGAVHTTQHTIRPALEVIRTAPGVSLVSSVFLMLLADRVLVYGDCAVNPSPDADGLADIAISSAGTAAAFGIEPRIAMLSYSTGTSGKGRAVEVVRRATELVRERRPDLDVDGPIQYDAAVAPAVVEVKLPGSAVAGRATVFVFPDLNTGNNTYKAVQRSSGAVAIGPVLQGLDRPVNDLSRGCRVEDVVNTIAITAIQAQYLMHGDDENVS